MKEVTQPEALAALLDREWGFTINGLFTLPLEGGTFDVENPSTALVVAQAPNGREVDVSRAVEAAGAAAPRWGATTIFERAQLVNRIADAISDRAEDFALIDAACGGGSLSEMRRDVATAIKNLRYFAGVAPQLTGQTIPASSSLHFTERVPFGVVARIVAFNHPFLFSVAKSAAPLMAGNAVVIKPPETAPLSALLLGELASQIFPPGVFSVIVGNGPEVPRALVRHPLVTRIGFVGSELTGRSIQKDAAETGVKFVTLELGGKNALIAYGDADIEAVAEAAVAGMNFAWAGQSCGSTSRLLIHESIADDVVSRVVEKVGKLRMGEATNESTQMGPVVSQRQLDRILGDIEEARSDGAAIRVGGGRSPMMARGYFVQPTVMEISRDMRIASKEVFGPVLSVIRWTDEDEMLSIANSVDYGLTAAIYTHDITAALNLARNLSVGYVWVNGVGRHFLGVPYGGFKASGIGRDEAFEELESYTQTRAVNIFL